MISMTKLAARLAILAGTTLSLGAACGGDDDDTGWANETGVGGTSGGAGPSDGNPGGAEAAAGAGDDSGGQSAGGEDSIDSAGGAGGKPSGAPGGGGTGGGGGVAGEAVTGGGSGPEGTGGGGAGDNPGGTGQVGQAGRGGGGNLAGASASTAAGAAGEGATPEAGPGGASTNPPAGGGAAGRLAQGGHSAEEAGAGVGGEADGGGGGAGGAVETGTTITITDVEDATINAGAGDTPLGAADADDATRLVLAVDLEDTSFNGEASSFLIKPAEAALESLSDETIVSAHLVLVQIDDGEGFDVFTVAEDWAEETVTFDEAPAADALIASIDDEGAGAEVRIDLTEVVRGWVSSGEAFGVRMEPTSSSGTTFNSHEADEDQPRFIIVVE